MVRNPVDNYASFVNYADTWLLPRIAKVVHANNWSAWHTSTWRPSATAFDIFMRKWQLHHQ
jgi:hypothetical protein